MHQLALGTHSALLVQPKSIYQTMWSVVANKEFLSKHLLWEQSSSSDKIYDQLMKFALQVANKMIDANLLVSTGVQ